MSNGRIDFLVKLIEDDKEKFISELRADIQNHVSAKTPGECLKLVTKRPGSAAVTWSISDGVPYVLRLVAFLRRKPYGENGLVYEVDSPRTEEILDIVLDRLSRAILSHQDAIGDMALAEIIMQDVARERFLDILPKDNAVARAAGAKGRGYRCRCLTAWLTGEITPPRRISYFQCY